MFDRTVLLALLVQAPLAVSSLALATPFHAAAPPYRLPDPAWCECRHGGEQEEPAELLPDTDGPGPLACRRPPSAEEVKGPREGPEVGARLEKQRPGLAALLARAARPRARPLAP